MTESVGIFGSREVDLDEVRAYLFNYVAGHDIHVVSGGAVGVDTEARRAAEFYRRPFTEHLPKSRSTAAKFARNKLIERDAVRGIAVWNGVSRGTLHTRALFHLARKPVHTEHVKNPCSY